MAASNEPVLAPKPRDERRQDDRTDRLSLGEKESKFVIKLSSPIPG